MLKGEAKPDLEGVRLVSDGPLQGVVVVHTEQVVEEAFLVRSLHTTCHRTNHTTINTLDLEVNTLIIAFTTFNVTFPLLKSRYNLIEYPLIFSCSSSSKHTVLVMIKPANLRCNTRTALLYLD